MLCTSEAQHHWDETLLVSRGSDSPLNILIKK